MIRERYRPIYRLQNALRAFTSTILVGHEVENRLLGKDEIPEDLVRVRDPDGETRFLRTRDIEKIPFPRGPWSLRLKKAWREMTRPLGLTELVSGPTLARELGDRIPDRPDRPELDVFARDRKLMEKFLAVKPPKTETKKPKKIQTYTGEELRRREESKRRLESLKRSINDK